MEVGSTVVFKYGYGLEEGKVKAIYSGGEYFKAVVISGGYRGIEIITETSRIVSPKKIEVKEPYREQREDGFFKKLLKKLW